jgi:hypothetical protein
VEVTEAIVFIAGGSPGVGLMVVTGRCGLAVAKLRVRYDV